MSKVDWSKAPEDAQFFSCGAFRRHEHDEECLWNGLKWVLTGFDDMLWHEKQPDFEIRPSDTPEPVSDEAKKDRSKYRREIKPGVWVDVYDVLQAFNPENRNAADDHAIKKMLLPGKRGAKDGTQDRKEAIASLERSIQILGDK